MNKKPSYMTSFVKPVSAIMLTAASLGMMPNANATTQISGQVAGMGVNPACTTCHVSAPGAESKTNLKAGYLNAFTTGGINALVNLIKAPAPAPAPVWKTVSGSVGNTTNGLRKTDIWAVSCPTGTSSLAISVRDLPQILAPVISIQAIKNGASSVLSKDAKDGDPVFSPTVKLAKGSGVYNVLVTKAASPTKGVELYAARFACLKSTGATVKMTVAPKLSQNQ